MSLLHPPPPSQTTSPASTACGTIPASTGTRTPFSGSSDTQLLSSIGLLSTHDGEQGTGTLSKHSLGTGRSVNLFTVVFYFSPYSLIIYILQAVVERYREGTREEFWAEFQDAKGRYLSFTAIVSRLKGERVEENERVAKRARREYGDAFASVFCYRKGSRHFTIRDPTRIANKYRMLHS
jgi:hypothetical protein